MSDRILIDARNDSMRLEMLVANDLQKNIDSYLPPSWPVRRLVEGYREFVQNGNTQQEVYALKRQVFTETKGLSHKTFSDVIASHIRKEKIDLTKTLFTRQDLKLPPEKRPDDAKYWDNQRYAGVKALRDNAYYVSKVPLPTNIMATLHKKFMKKLEGEHGAKAVQDSLDGKPGAERQLKTNSSWMFASEELLEIASDPLILSIVQDYLGVPTIYNTPVVMLNSHAPIKSQKELSDTAQQYHHDLHRLGFVKLFFYMTDVELGTGPHTLIKGTHRKRPDQFWEDGRHEDEDLKAAGLLKDEVKITGKAGTWMLVDTSALHKGAEPETGHRVLGSVQYTNSLFGYPIPKADHKIEAAIGSNSAAVQESAAVVRKYADKAGVRFMQNFI